MVEPGGEVSIARNVADGRSIRLTRDKLLSFVRPRGWSHGRQQKRYVMGVTSLWLVVPVVLGACSRPSSRRDPPWEVPLSLTVWVAVVCSASTVSYYALDTYWSGAMFVVDRMLALSTFVVLCVFFASGYGARDVPTGVLISLPAAALLLFLCSRYFEVVRPTETKAATLSHLTFRYVGYWWVYLALVGPAVEPGGFAISFVVDSLLYWGHVSFGIAVTGRRPDFHLHDRYLIGCLELCALLFVLVFARVALAHAESCALS